MQASAKTSLMADGGWEPLNYVYPRTSGGGTMPTLDRAYGRICKGEPMPRATLRTLQDLEPSAAGGVECVQGGGGVWAEGGRGWGEEHTDIITVFPSLRRQIPIEKAAENRL